VGTEITLIGEDGGETTGGVTGSAVTLVISQVPWMYRK
jgi:hypothetical protein